MTNFAAQEQTPKDMEQILQDKVWSTLPKEFKEEVKETYREYTEKIATTSEPEYRIVGYIAAQTELELLFGKHNLTSDAVGEEILTCEKSKAMQLYSHLLDLVENERMSEHYSEWCDLEREYIALFGENVFADYFGSKCLPDAHEDNFTRTEPKPSEPKFKIGDKVRVKFNAKELHSNPDPSKKIYYWQTTRDKYLGKVFKITDIWKSGTITLNTAEVMFWEPFDLEPYTEQREDLIPPNSGELESQEADKQFNTIIKDSFAKERRLNIAAQIVASMVGSDDWTTWRGGTNKEIWHNMAKSSLEIADELIRQSGKGDSK